MTPPQPIGLLLIGAMSSGQVILGELLSSRARLRFPSRPHRLSINSRSSSKSKRTAYREIPNCLTQGVHPKAVSPRQDPRSRLPPQTLEMIDSFTAAPLHAISPEFATLDLSDAHSLLITIRD